MRWIILTLLGIPLAVHSSHVVRAAIDVGSGGPKLRVAEVDLTTQRLLKCCMFNNIPFFFRNAYRIVVVRYSLLRSWLRELPPLRKLWGLHIPLA